MQIFTIGYGGRSPTRFVEDLTANGVASVVDVRAFPGKAHLGSYVKAKSREKGIEALLARAGIEYFWIEELGNPLRHADGWEDAYRDMLGRHGEERTARLDDVPRPFCLLCGEKDPGSCHRKLLAEWLEEHREGVSVVHL